MLEVNKENAVPPLTELMGWRKTHTSNQCPPCLMCSCDKRWEDKVLVLWAYKTGLQAGEESLWKWHLHKDPTATTRPRAGYGAEWSGKPWGQRRGLRKGPGAAGSLGEGCVAGMPRAQGSCRMRGSRGSRTGWCRPGCDRQIYTSILRRELGHWGLWAAEMRVL